MPGFEEYMSTIENHVRQGYEDGLLHQTIEDEVLNGKEITLHGSKFLNFGWAGYMALEFDERLKEGAIEAIKKYGTEHSCSRAFFQNSQYAELEILLEKTLGRPSIVAPSTTLAHFSALPSIVSEKDAIIIDAASHGSLHLAVGILKSRGIHVTKIPYNSVIQLERKLIRLKRNFQKVWYVADGVHSMYGTFCKVEKLKTLTNRHEQLWLYMD